MVRDKRMQSVEKIAERNSNLHNIDFEVLLVRTQDVSTLWS